MSEHLVLIVEDNPDTRELLAEQLSGLEIELMQASNGQDAILRVGERAPDLVLMDVMMPQLDGLETTRYLKLRFQDRYLPILVISARTDRESREKGAEHGCEDYRNKPYTKQQLLDSVQLLLQIGRLENALRVEETTDADRASLIDARLQLAVRLISEQSLGIARAHIERVLALDPENEHAQRLLKEATAST